MANTILTPGEENIKEPPIKEPIIPYLEKDNYLSEFQTIEEKAIARENLDVYSKDSVYNKTESDTLLDRTIKEAFDKYLNMEDPHGILPTVEEMIEGVVRNDGSTPFLAPQQGVDPVQDYHLATKRFVTRLLKEHTDAEDPHRILPEVEDMLEQYVKQSQVYFKNQLYTKNEIDQQSGQYIKKDGSTPFTKAQIGADPQIDSHLATKRYVDAVMYKHLVDVDPHGFIAILNKRLAQYAKVSNVYDKSQTYSRVQIDSIIRSLVHDAAKEAIIDHVSEFDPHNILAEVRKLKYTKQDGTTPFKAPQKGVDAVDPQDLVTLHQVEEKISEQLGEPEQPVWITSGPVEAQVGMVKEGDTLASSITFQEAMDAIFYGKRVKLTVPELSSIGESFPITLCIQGSLATVDYAEIWQNGKYLATITKEDLEESGCVTVDGLPIDSDSEVTAKVFYTNGSIHEVTETVSVALPVFIGIIPRWKFGNTVTYNQLLELSLEDSKNNKFYDKGIHLQSIEHPYDFDEDREQKIIVALPVTYNNLAEMSNSAQVVTSDAFEVIDQIPFQVPGSTSDIIYKIYIYKQDLYSLNTTMKFKFA